MAITHVKGGFFDKEHAGAHQRFGFKGSAGAPASGHPLGGTLEHVTRRFDGSTVEHYSHGGKTVNHIGGVSTHHKRTGTLIPSAAAPPPLSPDDGSSMQPAAMVPQGMGPDGSAPGGMKKGGSISRAEDEKQDRKMMIRMIAAEEKKEGRAGMAMGGHARLPRGMKPPVAHSRSPINTPPRKPQVTRTPKDDMAGGQMPYGMQPSSEPGYSPTTTTGSAPDDIAGGGALGGMKRGGSAKR